MIDPECNPFITGNTPVCDWIFKPADNFTVHVAPMKHFFKDFLVILKRPLQNN